jgi:hypothetical protein
MAGAKDGGTPPIFLVDTDLTTFQVPGGLQDEPPISINVTAIVKAEQRLDDVARVNSHTAPELLAIFNRCWLDLDKLVVALTDTKRKAEQAIDVQECNLTLECTDEKLKALGHTKASADLRKAWIGSQGNLIQAKSRLIEISTVLDYMKGKQKAFENGYNSVKKLIGPQLPNGSFTGAMPEPFTAPKPVQPKPVVVEETFDVDDDLPQGFGKLKL